MMNYGFYLMIVKLNFVINNLLLSKNIKLINYDLNFLLICLCG